MAVQQQEGQQHPAAVTPPLLNWLAPHEHLELPEQACLDLERQARVFA